MSASTKLLELSGVVKNFTTADGHDRTVLESVDFELKEGEIVALLGKSGSGKSTLLRIMAGLIKADQGRVSYRGNHIHQPVQGIAMVFQSFALFPWLTVQQNVELGLEAQGVAPEERQTRADAVLDLIGLSGFGGALPRELSGGMRQRVGIARALVTNPDILLMDEAFSALDVLTGETLRDDILELWQERRIPTKGILVVSHNIEEAVMMADRVMIFSSDPGRVKAEIPIHLPRPRNAESSEVRALVDEVYAIMTQRPISSKQANAAEADVIAYRLPDADIGLIEGVLDLLGDEPFNGTADLPRLSEVSELSDDDLLQTFEALGMLGLATIEGGDIHLTPIGHSYYQVSQRHKQEIFGQLLIEHVPLAKHIRMQLEREESGVLSEKKLLERLNEALKLSEAERVLNVAIEWGRYGELYEYDYHAGVFELPEEDD